MAGLDKFGAKQTRDLVVLDTTGYSLSYQAASFGLGLGQWSTLTMNMSTNASAELHVEMHSATDDQYVMLDDIILATELSGVDFCASSPCQNGATCITPLSTYRYWCNCTLDFEGQDCEFQRASECASNPCKHGATCVDGVQAYTCRPVRTSTPSPDSSQSPQYLLRARGLRCAGRGKTACQPRLVRAERTRRAL